jgi:hypothetical protein
MEVPGERSIHVGRGVRAEPTSSQAIDENWRADLSSPGSRALGEILNPMKKRGHRTSAEKR